MKVRYLSVIFILCLLNMSCLSISLKDYSDSTNYWDSEEVLENAIGSFEVLGDGKSPLYEYILGTYAIKAKIKNGTEEKNVCFIVDTGAKGNVISKKTLQSFSSAFEEKYRFISNYTYSTASDFNVPGVVIPEFCTDGFRMENVLFEQTDIESFGWLEDGTPVDGFIGMITLSQLPFLFSASNKELVFFEKDFNPKGNECELDKEYALILQIPVEIENKNYLAKLDTGGETNLIPYSMYKKLGKNIDGDFELRMFGLKRRMGLQNSFNFLGTECKNIPVIAQKSSFSIGHDDYVMIGETVLRNFDIYIDYNASRIYFDPIECDFPKRSMLMVYTSGGGNRYGYFGLNLARDKYNGKLKVASLYYQNGKKLCPEVSIGDYVISINGIDQKDFVLEELKDMAEIEITLQHKSKIYTVKLNRNNLDECLQF